MKLKFLSKKGTALMLSGLLAVGSFAVSAGQLLEGDNQFTFVANGSPNNPSGDSSVTPPPGNSDEVVATGITLSKTSLTLKVGESETLTATVEPENATDKTVKWEVGDSGIATVDGTGDSVTVKAVKAGETTVTATTANGKPAQCTVTVLPADETDTPPADEPSTEDPGTKPPAEVAVTDIKLSTQGFTLAPGKTGTITATVVPENATKKDVTWTSSDEKVATVVQSGNTTTVTAVSEGTATVTAAAGGKTAACTVTVKADKVDAQSVTLSNDSLIIGKDKTATLTATVNPDNTTDKTVTWSSSNDKVASVDPNGTVTGKKAGEATITVTTVNGKTADCKVTVAEVKLNAASMPLQKGKSTSALKIASQSLASDKVSSWESSDSKVATVNKKGVVKAKKVGKATITLTMKSGATASCKVTVQKNAVKTKSIKLPKKITLATKESLTLEVTRNPISATDKITWTTSKKDVVTVNSSGKITAKKVGTATITAKTANGKKATCKVTVKKPAVKLVKSKATLKVGKSTTIEVKSTLPANDKVKSYKSSSTKVATVTKKGKVTAKKAGKAKITVTMKSGAKATFNVTVKK